MFRVWTSQLQISINTHIISAGTMQMFTKSSWIHAYVRSLLKALRRISFNFSSAILVRINLKCDNVLWSWSCKYCSYAIGIWRSWRCLAHLAMQPMSMFTYPHVKTVGQYLLTCHYSRDMPNDRSEEQDCYLKDFVHRKRSFERIEIHVLSAGDIKKAEIQRFQTFCRWR